MRVIPLFLIFGIAFSIQVSETFFGVNYWYFENLSEKEFRAVVEKLSEIPVDVIRIGGMWYDAKGVKRWVLEDFFHLCEILEATPVVQIPMNSHTVEDLESFVRKVRSIYEGKVIWSIGNEMDIYSDVDFKWVKAYSMKEAFELYGRMLERLEEIEDDPVVWGPDLSWKWRPWMIGDWTTPFLRRFHVDVFSIHRYPFRYVFSWDELVRDVDVFYAEMRRLKREVRLPVALTETNVSWDWNFCGEYSPAGEFAGLWFASILVRAMVIGIENVSIWSVVNDSCLSMLVVEGGEMKERGTFKALRVFKDVPRSVEGYSLSRWIDSVDFGKILIVVNRFDRSVKLKMKANEIDVPPLGVYRYTFDGGWHLEKSWEVGR